MTGLGIPPGLLAHAFPAPGLGRAEMPEPPAERVADGWHAAVAGIEHLPGMLPPVTQTGDGGFLARTPAQGPGDQDPAGSRPPPGAAPASPVPVSAPLPPVVRADVEAFLARTPGQGNGDPDDGLPKSFTSDGTASPAPVSVPLPPAVHADGGAFLMRAVAPPPGNPGAAPQQTPTGAEAQEPAARAVPAPVAAAQPAPTPMPGTTTQSTTASPVAAGQPVTPSSAQAVTMALPVAPTAAMPAPVPQSAQAPPGSPVVPHNAPGAASPGILPSAPSVPLSPQLPAAPQAASSQAPPPPALAQPPPVTAHESSLPATLRSVLSEAGYARPPDASQSLLPQMAHHGAALSPVLLAAPGLAFVPEALIAFRRGCTQAEANLQRSRKRPPPEPELLAFPTQAGGAEILAFTDKRALPLDIAPMQPVVQCWRIDDTQALVKAARDRHAAARRAEALHAALMAAMRPLEAIGEGEGFVTWLGSPLWLAIARIAKPAELGILLAESSPARVEVLRVGAHTWRVTHEGVSAGAVHEVAGAQNPALRHAVLYGAAASDSAALARGGRLPAPQSWRVQEAWAAVQRVRSRAATQEEASVADLFFEGRAGLALEAMRRHGREVLDQVRQGEVHGIGAKDGLALALALGRLGPTRIALRGSA